MQYTTAEGLHTSTLAAARRDDANIDDTNLVQLWPPHSDHLAWRWWYAIRVGSGVGYVGWSLGRGLRLSWHAIHRGLVLLQDKIYGFLNRFQHFSPFLIPCHLHPFILDNELGLHTGNIRRKVIEFRCARDCP